MKKGFSILMMIVAAVIVVSSCSESQRTYTEMLKDERKIIKKLIDSLDIKLLDDYPENGVFAENEFFQLPSGLYINVIDSGNGNRAVANQIISCRFEFDYFNGKSGTSETVNGFDNEYHPLEFKFGYSSVLEGSKSVFSGFYGQGIVEPLSFVGDSSYVKLIVPFKVGGQSQQTGGDPIYYKKLRYLFD
ncbi:DUF4827 family protein [Massilibacteroides vaginae]|uniref:DUF4827 family protein n=1 Tax=Massilibacteroides vaginae TaxID=1673718 RepID=UPI000A1CA38C|nr:DUF4827 family protein [Massilibacteroides vaginae]